MSLGLVVLEKKLFTRTRTPTPQSDDIKNKEIFFVIILISTVLLISAVVFIYSRIPGFFFTNKCIVCILPVYRLVL